MLLVKAALACSKVKKARQWVIFQTIRAIAPTIGLFAPAFHASLSALSFGRCGSRLRQCRSVWSVVQGWESLPADPPGSTWS